ncbi:hypothetical protein STANM309S_02579 [Streptomyces tanashiensis]
MDSRNGPNLACEGCGQAVATRVDDCGQWQAVWLEPDAVGRRPSALPAGPTPGWDDLERAEHRVAPVEPDGSWRRRWEAAAGVALAHLVVATEGRPVTLPSGPAPSCSATPSAGTCRQPGPVPGPWRWRVPGSARRGRDPTSCSSPATP